MRPFVLPALVALGVALSVHFVAQNHQPTDLRTIAAVAHLGHRDPKTVLAGRRAVVTGITSGIGEAVAVALLGLGATVYGVARSESKLQAFAAANAGLPGTFRPVVSELSDFESVARAADQIVADVGSEGSLDYLVNNAGFHYGGPFQMMRQDTRTKSGIDKCFTVNYLSHVLLTEKLLPLLEKGQGDSRVVQVSSGYHWQSSAAMLKIGEEGMPFAANGSVKDFGQRRLAYSNSKLAQIYHARALATAKPHSRVKFISVCPGWVGTSIAPEGLLRAGLKALAFTPDQGIYSTLNALFRPEIQTGDFVGTSNLITKLPLFKKVLTSQFASVTVPEVRRLLTDLYVMFMMLYQKHDFGYYVQQSSPESYDGKTGDALYKWSSATLKPWL